MIKIIYYFVKRNVSEKKIGKRGKKHRGVLRTHQFSKIELFCFVNEELEIEYFDKICSTIEYFLNMLKFKYQKMILCTGDISKHVAKTIDYNIWFPITEQYIEISSVSSCKEYQLKRR